MDMNVVRGIVTLITMILFIVLCVWVFSKKNSKTYDEASKMALEDDANTDEHKKELANHE